MESKLYDIEKLKYPIGKFIKPTVIDKIIIDSWINDIENLPAQIKATLAKLSIAELQKPYRPDGWTKIQVINHIADSHMNALIRIKLALTENSPTIKPYNQNGWANLEDGKNTPIEISLAIIEGVHYRLALLLRSLVDVDFEKVFIHPEYKIEYKIKESIGTYAWHGKHHLKHLEQVW
jgi:DinB superfamily